MKARGVLSLAAILLCGATSKAQTIRWEKITPYALGAYELNPILYAEGKFVAAGAVILYSEDDGLSWREGKGLKRTGYQALSHGNGRFVAITTGNEAAWSEDGITWTYATVPGATGLRDLSFGNNLFVAVG